MTKLFGTSLINGQLLFFFWFGCLPRSYSCEIDWKKVITKTPFYESAVRPQGISSVGENVYLTNHYKDSTIEDETSDFLILDVDFNLQSKLKFPMPYRHIGGLSTYEGKLFAVDFDEAKVLSLKISSPGTIKVTEILDIPEKGPSSIAVYKDILVVSFYILPHRYPFFKDRKIRFFNLKTGLELKFKGEVLESNFSQGLTFFKQNDKLFLVESINVFKSVLCYWITGKDGGLDILRVYSIDLENKRFTHIKDLQTPLYMIEDLAWDGKNRILTTDEQNFHFYEGRIFDCE